MYSKQKKLFYNYVVENSFWKSCERLTPPSLTVGFWFANNTLSIKCEWFDIPPFLKSYWSTKLSAPPFCTHFSYRLHSACVCFIRTIHWQRVALLWVSVRTPVLAQTKYSDRHHRLQWPCVSVELINSIFFFLCDFDTTLSDTSTVIW